MSNDACAPGYVPMPGTSTVDLHYPMLAQAGNSLHPTLPRGTCIEHPFMPCKDLSRHADPKLRNQGGQPMLELRRNCG
jgi:hypothetical protein